MNHHNRSRFGEYSVSSIPISYGIVEPGGYLDVNCGARNEAGNTKFFQDINHGRLYRFTFTDSRMYFAWYLFNGVNRYRYWSTKKKQDKRTHKSPFIYNLYYIFN